MCVLARENIRYSVCVPVSTKICVSIYTYMGDKELRDAKRSMNYNQCR